MEGVPNELMGEQTWPSEAEMYPSDDPTDPTAGRNRRNVPGAVCVYNINEIYAL
jgi:hypothetical protein